MKKKILDLCFEFEEIKESAKQITIIEKAEEDVCVFFEEGETPQLPNELRTSADCSTQNIDLDSFNTINIGSKIVLKILFNDDSEKIYLFERTSEKHTLNLVENYTAPTCIAEKVIWSSSN